MKTKSNKDAYSLLHQVSNMMVKGPYQGLAVRPGQNKVLKFLESDGDLRQQQLLEKLGIRPSSLTELLKKLEAEDLISRKRSNRGGREMIVSLTEKGRISLLENRLAKQERDQTYFGCLTQKEREQLVSTLDKLLCNWRETLYANDGERRERNWKDISAMQSEQREINALLEAVK